jgi:hypothetical protein
MKALLFLAVATLILAGCSTTSTNKGLVHVTAKAPLETVRVTVAAGMMGEGYQLARQDAVSMEWEKKASGAARVLFADTSGKPTVTIAKVVLVKIPEGTRITAYTALRWHYFGGEKVSINESPAAKAQLQKVLQEASINASN